jgi:hypothetical protein
MKRNCRSRNEADLVRQCLCEADDPDLLCFTAFDFRGQEIRQPDDTFSSEQTISAA